MAQSRLPRDAESVLKLAAQSMFDLFSTMSEGMMLVDRGGRVVWINEGYKRFLPALGIASADQFVGRPVDEVVPNTLMRQVIETGKPILVDLLTNKAGTFVVSRIPLRDDAGEVIGALGTAEEMRLRGPGAVVVTIAGCGHAPALNVPGQLSLVRRFLNGMQSGAGPAAH